MNINKGVSLYTLIHNKLWDLSIKKKKGKKYNSMYSMLPPMLKKKKYTHTPIHIYAHHTESNKTAYILDYKNGNFIWSNILSAYIRIRYYGNT